MRGRFYAKTSSLPLGAAAPGAGGPGWAGAAGVGVGVSTLFSQGPRCPPLVHALLRTAQPDRLRPLKDAGLLG